MKENLSHLSSSQGTICHAASNPEQESSRLQNLKDILIHFILRTQ